MSFSRRAAGATNATALRHNPLNAVTATVERITDAEGHTLIRKELQEPTGTDGPWKASEDPRHWNYWRRELEVYRDDRLREQLAGTGLVLPEAEVEEHPAARFSSWRTLKVCLARSSLSTIMRHWRERVGGGRRGPRMKCRGPRSGFSTTTPRLAMCRGSCSMTTRPGSSR
ncbi:hypothetical protein [Kribbella sp. VKM Ac-2568]|uniref:hypothetical protein n=1 Tax=Kribbella sp. VKM Ac-2568 TaxID=2512219 RepID=UPI0018EE7976|nr:hypothetical protein [Kribbella sp. VKM Ac-2568]